MVCIDLSTMTIETERAMNKLRWKRIIGDNGSCEEELVKTEDDMKNVNINKFKCSDVTISII